MERQLGLLYVNVKVSWWTLVRQAGSGKREAGSGKREAGSGKREAVSVLFRHGNQGLDRSGYWLFTESGYQKNILA